MELVLRPARVDDYPRVAAIISSQVPEPVTAEDIVRDDSIVPKGDHFLRMVAELPDGTIAATGVSHGGTLMEEGHFQVNTRVDKPHRRQGVGKALYEALERYAVEHGATVMEGSVRELDPFDVAWAERRGYVKEHHVFESTLNLAGFDPEPFRDAMTRVRDQGFRFTTLGALGTDEAMLRRYFDFMWEVSRDVPGTENQPKPPFEVIRQYWENNPRISLDRIFLAVDGDRWAAVAELHAMPSGALYNGFTGVQRDYRGRGLALAVKLIAIEHGRSQGAPSMRTNNHSSNQRMLAVNRRLGYQPLPGLYQIKKSLV